MGPTGGLRDVARLEDRVEAGIAIGMQDTDEALEVRLGILALAVG
jgi:hypothetical protein